MALTILIIDDETLARARVRSFLNTHANVTILGEADNGFTALQMIHEQKPDVIFLDIQMPEMDGFSLLAELSPEERPIIIFTTAYDEYAIKAFEVHALDYLLKPFSKDRFNIALERAKELVSMPVELTQKIDALLSDIPLKTIKRLCIKDLGRMHFIPLESILWIESAGNYAEIHHGQHTHLLRQTMMQLERQLPPHDFMRISRSAILRLDAITEIRSFTKGEHHVILTSGAKIKATIPLKELQEKLEQS